MATGLIHERNHVKRVLICAVVGALVGCGGSDDAGTSGFAVVNNPSGGSGSGSNPTTPNVPATTSRQAAAGLWVGTTDTNRTGAGLVFADGSYYFIYSRPGDASVIGGVTAGTLSVSGPNVVSNDGRDFNLEGQGLNTGTATATPVAKMSLNGSVTYTRGTTVKFNLSYDPSFELTPMLADLVGSYTGSSVSSRGVQSTSVTINASGAFGGTVAGCNYSGAATPRTDGNAFNLTVSFGGPPCLFAGETLNGIGHYNASARQFIALAGNNTRTDGFLAVLNKP